MKAFSRHPFVFLASFLLLTPLRSFSQSIDQMYKMQERQIKSQQSRCKNLFDTSTIQMISGFEVNRWSEKRIAIIQGEVVIISMMMDGECSQGKYDRLGYLNKEKIYTGTQANGKPLYTKSMSIFEGDYLVNYRTTNTINKVIRSVIGIKRKKGMPDIVERQP